ncbi:kielin/chordin-like protein [Mya arenaria]|uniref:kielin/chordin-like protein n=1 Tax=Mya arenaria TaxID=6604 RepID=UPI0022E1FE91|nr:kielin/chordin-like protein [Mya arenaria]
MEMICFAIFVFFFCSGVKTQPPLATGCQYHGRNYHVSDVWVDMNGCNICECNQYGAQCYGTQFGCQLNKTNAAPLSPACHYATKSYLVGDVFTTLDGCNKCLCTERGQQCTAKQCNKTGFEQPSKTPIYGECHYNEGWYHYQTQWLATDGCNTCYCHSIGNYQGGYECTKSKCSCHDSSVLTG